MNVRRIHTQEGPRLRELRLSALADAPTAFGSTLAEEQARPGDAWDLQAEEEARSTTHARFVAEENARWYGMAAGFVLPDQPETVQLASMWVDPARRRSGVGTALVEAVVKWARGRSAKHIELWVSAPNYEAKALYVQTGFAETKRTQPLPSNPTLQEVLMVRELA